MPRTKTTPTKRSPKQMPGDVADDPKELTDLPVSKIKKVPDVDLHDDISGIVDDKPEIDPLASDEEADESGAEESLDEEEIDPFGDKWEI